MPAAAGADGLPDSEDLEGLSKDELARLVERLQRSIQTSASNRADIERVMRALKAQGGAPRPKKRAKRKAAKKKTTRKKPARKNPARKKPAKNPKRRSR